MTTRPINSTLKTSLLNEEPFVYAHLVKFEKGIRTLSGESGKGANTYSYITDGSFDISFNDGSQDAAGNYNGSQTYIASKLLAVGAISERTHASASSLTLNISGSALNTTLSTSITTTSSTITATVDLVEAGFSEGDKIKLVFASSSTTNHNQHFRINSFTNNNKTAVVTSLDSSLSTVSTARAVTIEFASEEVLGPIRAKESTGYASYINRDVFVYKAHIDPDTGAIIGAPYLIFKGIISSSKLTEDPSRGTTVSWSCTSHWGDFVRINGRVTSDSEHRALTASGVSDAGALKRPEYQGDLGFLHSEQAINLMAIYQVKETRTKVKYKKGFLGFGSKVKTQEYQVDVDRELDLRFNLEAKYLPVVYGVQRVDSIPVFVDSLKTDSKKVYVAYALCEGPIASLYDIYFDDVSSICIDGKDFDTRSSQNDQNTVDVLCTGRADRGDTLSGVTVNGTTQVNYGYTTGVFGSGTFDILDEYRGDRQAQNPYGFNIAETFTTGSTSGAAQGVGTLHEKGNTFVTPIDTRLVFHAGKDNQKADNFLSSIAQSNNFKIQSDYYTGTADYWGPNHQLLDTAYVVAEYTIGEGEITIPTLDFTVRGKILEAYNYDYSYTKDPTRSSANISSFSLGMAIELRDSSTNTKLGSNNTVADIYTFIDETGTTETRVRLQNVPTLGTTKAFYINPVGNTGIRWYMSTYDCVFNSGTVQEELSEEIISTTTGSSQGSAANISSSTATAIAATLPYVNNVTVAPVTNYSSELTDEQIEQIIYFLSQNYSFDGVSAGGTIKIDNLGSATNLSSSQVNVVVIKDAIKLSSTASTTSDAYNNLIIEVRRENTQTGDVYVQKRKIIDYDGASRIATVDKPFDALYIPRAGDTFKILPLGDRRVSINPAIQLLDYITNTKYGRGLDIDNDLNMSSFLQAARSCDTRSDVTVQFPTSAVIAVNDVWHYPSTGTIQFQGTVKSVQTINGYKQVVFTDVIGKLGYKWHDWKTYPSGQLIWHTEYATNGSYLATYLTTGTGSTRAKPTSSTVSSVTMKKLGTSTTANINITTASSADGNVLVKQYSGNYGQTYVSGYSLYDSDDVKYWRYVGWDSQDQRHVTRHQTNMVVTTSASIFDNINSMLEHFNGILRHSNGKYDLTVATGSVSFDDAEIFDESDIIGEINIEDAGQKGTFNTVSTSVSDPQIMFGERSVTFFNSNYLKEDKNIPKKGDIKTPFITNYYNSRINAKQYLDRSRYGLSINFTVGPRGALLLAGEIIKLSHERFGWNEKMFRISSLTLKENCLVQVTAEEHNDSAFLISNISEASLIGVGGVGVNTQAAPVAPTGLAATQNNIGGVELTWVNSNTYRDSTYSVEIWRSLTEDFADATLRATTKGNTYVDSIIAEGRNTYYYWIRYAVLTSSTSSDTIKQIYSEYNPGQDETGIQGISDSTVAGITVTLTNENSSVSINADGSLNYTGTGNTIAVYSGDTQLTYDNDDSDGYANLSFRVAVESTSGITVPTPTNTANTWSHEDLTAMSINRGVITYTITVVTELGTEITFSRILNVVRLANGNTAVIVSAYKRSASAVTTNPGNVSVDLTTGQITTATLANNWSKTIPAGNDPLYITQATAAGAGTEDTITAGEWSTPVILSKDGQDALNTATVFIYQRTSNGVTPPSLPTGNTTYTFSTGAAVFTTANGWSRDISSTGGKYLWVSQATASSTSGTDTIAQGEWADASLLSTDGTDATGINARTVSLSAPKVAFAYDQSGSNPSPATVQVTATAVNSEGTKYYQFLVNGSEVQHTTGNTYTYTPAASFADMPQTIQVNLREGSTTSTILARDLVGMVGLRDAIDGVDSIEVVLENPTHAMFKNASGTITYTGSGTVIRVYEGTSPLVYDAVGTAAGRWKVTPQGFGITPSSTLTDNGDYVTVDAHTDMTGTTAKVQYTISGVRENGTAFTIIKNQTFAQSIEGTPGSAGINSRSVSLSTTDLAFAYNGNGSSPTPANATVTATALNTVGTVYYDFLVNGTSVKNSTENFFSYTPQASFSNMPDTVQVDVREGADDNPVIVAKDTIAMTGLRDAINGVTPPGQNINLGLVFAGNMTIDDTYLVLSKGGTSSGWDGSVRSTVGYTSGAVATLIPNQTNKSLMFGLNTDPATNNSYTSIDYAIYLIANGTIKVYENGADRGIVGAGYSAGDIFQVVYDNQTVKYLQNSTLLRSLTVAPDLKLFFDSSFATVGTNLTRSFGFTPTGASGSNALTFILSNDSHTLPQDIDGTITYTGSGTRIDVYEGTEPLAYDGVGTSNGTWKITAAGTNITPSDTFTDGGNYVTVEDEHSGLTSNTATIDYTISGKRENGTTFSVIKTQTFSKSTSVKGDPGNPGVAGTSNAIVYAYQRSSSALTSNPGEVTVNLATGQITTASLQNSWSKTIDGTTGTAPLYVTVATASGTGATDTIAASEWTTPAKLSQNGADGNNVASVFIYRRTTTSTAPAKPAGNTTYTFSTGAVAFTTDNGWTKGVPSTGGDWLWVTQATAYSSTSTDTIPDTEWAAPTIVSVNGTNGGPGAAGLRTVQGYLYYEKTTAGAPTAPTEATYTFATGDINGGSGVTEVLGLADTSAVNKWTNQPRTQDPTSSNTHYTIRYYGTETAANSSTLEVTYSNIVQYTNFSGVVTFSNGTFREGNTDITAIDGGNIDTGTITASKLTVDATQYVNPISRTENIFRWGGYDEFGERATALPSGIILDWDTTEKAMRLRCDGNVGISSDSFIIDHNSIYKISCKVRKTATSTTSKWYIGAFQHSVARAGLLSDGGNVAGNTTLTTYNVNKGASSTANAYFTSATRILDTNYDEFTFYIVGANRDVSEAPNYKAIGEAFYDVGSPPVSTSSWSSLLPWMKANASSNHVGLRFLNWDNSTTVSDLYIKDVSITEVGTGEIIADNIAANAITTEKLEISNDSTGGNGIYMDGTNKRIEIYNNGILRVRLGKL